MSAVARCGGARNRLANEQADKALRRDALHRAARVILIQSPAGMGWSTRQRIVLAGPDFINSLLAAFIHVSSRASFHPQFHRMLPTGSRRRSKVTATTSMEASPWASCPRCAGDSTCAHLFMITMPGLRRAQQRFALAWRPHPALTLGDLFVLMDHRHGTLRGHPQSTFRLLLSG